MTSFMNGPFAHWREFSVANNVSLLAYSLPHRCCSHPVRFVLAARIAWPTKNEKKNHVVIDTRWWLYSCIFMIIKVHIFWEGQKFCEISTVDLTNLRWRFHKDLWPSENVWILLKLIYSEKAGNKILWNLHLTYVCMYCRQK